MRKYNLFSDLAYLRFIVHFRDSQRLYGNILAFEHSHSNIGKATGSARDPGKIELCGQQVGIRKVSYPAT